MTNRQASPIVRNPLLGLPAAQAIATLPPESRKVLADLLREIAIDAAGRAEVSWRKSKAPMAAYWKAVSIYAKHSMRLCRGGQ